MKRIGLNAACLLATAIVISAGITAPALADTVVTAPFSWQGQTWCPTYYEMYGCDNVQTYHNPSVAFYPSQVTTSSGQIWLNMNASATESGAFNSQGYEVWSAPATLSEQITLPCNSSGQIENWPAFWLVTTGSWPAGGEIDVMEGLSGVAAWHYHYVNASGQSSQVGGVPAQFSGCGTHTYSLIWTSSTLTFYYDGVQVGQVTSSQIGVPIATGPMYVINDYAASSTYGGPTTGGVTMQVDSFTSA